MRVLIDECLPRRLAAALVGVEARTVPEAGWAGKTNGELLALAEGEFDVFLTIDQNLVHQQHVEGRQLAVVVIAAPSNRFDVLAPLVRQLLEALLSVAATNGPTLADPPDPPMVVIAAGRSHNFKLKSCRGSPLRSVAVSVGPSSLREGQRRDRR